MTNEQENERTKEKKTERKYMVDEYKKVQQKENGMMFNKKGKKERSN